MISGFPRKVDWKGAAEFKPHLKLLDWSRPKTSLCTREMPYLESGLLFDQLMNEWIKSVFIVHISPVIYLITTTIAGPYQNLGFNGATKNHSIVTLSIVTKAWRFRHRTASKSPTFNEDRRQVGCSSDNQFCKYCPITAVYRHSAKAVQGRTNKTQGL